MLEKVTIAPVKSTDEILEVARMANIIWREHYIPIIGKPQVDYMLEHFQSAQAMQQQIQKGVFYYIILKGNEKAGYLAFEKQKDVLFLSKIYLLESYRGYGIGKRAMEYVETQAIRMKCNIVTLTVNKYNDRSIKAYSRMGFIKTGGEVTDIGGGFAMDDYRMSKKL